MDFYIGSGKTGIKMTLGRYMNTYLIHTCGDVLEVNAEYFKIQGDHLLFYDCDHDAPTAVFACYGWNRFYMKDTVKLIESRKGENV